MRPVKRLFCLVLLDVRGLGGKPTRFPTTSREVLGRLCKVLTSGWCGRSRGCSALSRWMCGLSWWGEVALSSTATPSCPCWTSNCWRRARSSSLVWERVLGLEAGQARVGGSITTQPAEDIPLLTPLWGISAPVVRYIDMRAARVAIKLYSVLRCVMEGKCWESAALPNVR